MKNLQITHKLVLLIIKYINILTSLLINICQDTKMDLQNQGQCVLCNEYICLVVLTVNILD